MLAESTAINGIRSRRWGGKLPQQLTNIVRWTALQLKNLCKKIRALTGQEKELDITYISIFKIGLAVEAEKKIVGEDTLANDMVKNRPCRYSYFVKKERQKSKTEKAFSTGERKSQPNLI